MAERKNNHNYNITSFKKVKSNYILKLILLINHNQKIKII